MRPAIGNDGGVRMPPGTTAVEIEIPELRLTPAQREHEQAIFNAGLAVERAVGETEIRAAVDEMCRLIKDRDRQVTLALEDARMCRVYDRLRGRA